MPTEETAYLPLHQQPATIALVRCFCSVIFRNMTNEDPAAGLTQSFLTVAARRFWIFYGIFRTAQYLPPFPFVSPPPPLPPFPFTPFPFSSLTSEADPLKSS